LEKIWKEVTVAFIWVTEENHEKPQPEQPVSGPRSEPNISLFL
jgi:hypothetical protein